MDQVVHIYLKACDQEVNLLAWRELELAHNKHITHNATGTHHELSDDLFIYLFSFVSFYLFS